MKEKNIHINIKNTNIIKDKPKKKRRRRTIKKSQLNKTILGNPQQYPNNQPIIITQPQPIYNNDEAKGYSKNYLLLKNEPEDANKNYLLLKNEPEDTNKNNLLLNNGTEDKKQEPDKNIKKQSKITYKKNTFSQRPINYTYKGLMSIKTIYELKRAMKLKDPSIPDAALDSINSYNKSDAVRAFLNHLDNKPSPQKTNNNNQPIVTLPPSTIKTEPEINNNVINYTKEELNKMNKQEIKDLFNINFPKVDYNKKITKTNLINLFLEKQKKLNHNEENYNTPVKFQDQTATTQGENIMYDTIYDDNQIPTYNNPLLELIKNNDKNLKKNLKKINKETENKLQFESPLKKYSKMIEPKNIESEIYDDDILINDLIKTAMKKYNSTPDKTTEYIKNDPILGQGLGSQKL